MTSKPCLSSCQAAPKPAHPPPTTILLDMVWRRKVLSGASLGSDPGFEGLGGLVPRGTLTGDPRRHPRGRWEREWRVSSQPRLTKWESRDVTGLQIWRRVFAGPRRILVNGSPVLSQDPRPPLERHGRFEAARCYGTRATARRRKSKPRSRPASAARVPFTSAKQLIFGRKIGEGTQGEVRLARHATTARYVVKILDLDDPDDPNDPSTVSSRAAANDAKRQVSSLTDEEAGRSRRRPMPSHALAPERGAMSRHYLLDPTGDDPTSRRRSRLCIVMSHCEGGDLATSSPDQRPAPTRGCRRRWLAQLLLADPHSKNVLHRDLKPANVFLKNLRCVKIGDFGIAKALEREDDLAVTRVGTRCTCRRSSSPVNRTYASDVWALGCVAYELASGGKRAFDADSLPQLMCKVMTCDYPPVRRTSRGNSNASWDRCWTRTRTRPTAAVLLRHPLCAPTPKRGSRSREVRSGRRGKPRRRASPRGEGGGRGAGPRCRGRGILGTGNSPREFAEGLR